MNLEEREEYIRYIYPLRNGLRIFGSLSWPPAALKSLAAAKAATAFFALPATTLTSP